MGGKGSKGKKNKGDKDKKKKFVLKDFKKVGVDEVDGVFDSFYEILKGINELSENMEKADIDFLTLKDIEEIVKAGVAPTTAAIMQFVIDDLKKNKVEFELVIEGDNPGIEIKVKPEGYLAAAIDKIIALVKAVAKVAKEVPELANGFEELAKKIEEFDVKSMANGLGPMEIAKAVANFAHNAKISASAPKDVEELINTVKETINILKETFQGKPVSEEEKKEIGKKEKDLDESEKKVEKEEKKLEEKAEKAAEEANEEESE